MKFPKQQKRYCAKCKTHTEQKVTIAKRKGMNATNHQTTGSRTRQKARDRGVGIGSGNKGKFSRGAGSKWKATGKKLTKKTDFRYTCPGCNKISVPNSKGMRLKKVELV